MFDKNFPIQTLLALYQIVLAVQCTIHQVQHGNRRLAKSHHTMGLNGCQTRVVKSNPKGLKLL